MLSTLLFVAAAFVVWIVGSTLLLRSKMLKRENGDPKVEDDDDVGVDLEVVELAFAFVVFVIAFLLAVVVRPLRSRA